MGQFPGGWVAQEKGRQYDDHMVNACIDDWVALNRQQVALVGKIANGLSADHMHWNPAPGSWSIAQCLDHLNRTTALYRPNLEKAMAKKNPAGTQEYRRSWIGNKLIGFAGPGGQKKIKAPRAFKPSEQPETEGVADFIERQQWLMDQMIAARTLNLNKPKLSSPAIPLLRMSIGVAFDMLVQHAQRHVNQAMRVRQHEDFPDRSGSRLEDLTHQLGELRGVDGTGRG